MKATITKVTKLKSFEGKHGTLYGYKIEYDGKEAFYNSKSADQNWFNEGQETVFNEFPQTGAKGEYLQIKPIYDEHGQKRSSYGKRLHQERARYSSFAVSYCKDLIVAGVLDFTDMDMYATKLVTLMESLDDKVNQ